MITFLVKSSKKWTWAQNNRRFCNGFNLHHGAIYLQTWYKFQRIFQICYFSGSVYNLFIYTNLEDLCRSTLDEYKNTPVIPEACIGRSQVGRSLSIDACSWTIFSCIQGCSIWYQWAHKSTICFKNLIKNKLLFFLSNWENALCAPGLKSKVLPHQCGPFIHENPVMPLHNRTDPDITYLHLVWGYMCLRDIKSIKKINLEDAWSLITLYLRNNSTWVSKY